MRKIVRCLRLSLAEYGDQYQKHIAKIFGRLASYKTLRFPLYENGIMDSLLALRDSGDPDARQISLDAVFDMVKEDSVVAAIPANSDLMQMMVALSRFGSTAIKAGATKIVQRLSKFQEARIKKERAKKAREKKERERAKARKKGRK